MENIVITETENNILTLLRKRSAQGMASAYGANVEYAAELNKVFAAFSTDWFDLSHTDTSAEGKLVRAEKLAYFEELKAVKHSNPSKVWADIRKYARADKYPQPDPETGEGVEQAEQGESGKAGHNKSPMLRNMDDLTALWKFNARQTDLPEKVRRAQVKIGEALQALGVDLHLLNAK